MKEAQAVERIKEEKGNLLINSNETRTSYFRERMEWVRELLFLPSELSKRKTKIVLAWSWLAWNGTDFLELWMLR